MCWNWGKESVNFKSACHTTGNLLQKFTYPFNKYLVIAYYVVLGIKHTKKILAFMSLDSFENILRTYYAPETILRSTYINSLNHYSHPVKDILLIPQFYR